MGYEFRKEREAVFLGLHGAFSGRDAACGRLGRVLNAWKASESHFQSPRSCSCPIPTPKKGPKTTSQVKTAHNLRVTNLEAPHQN